MTIEKIRANINDNIGNQVRVFYNEGRNKRYEYNGRIVETYISVFIILGKEDIKKCFSYCDILIKNIEISF